MSLAVAHRPSRLSLRSRTTTVKRIANHILAHLGLEKSELSVVLCDNAFIQDLNRQWRQKDRPTDVLSFPAAEVAEVEAHRRDPDGHPLVLGDVVISLDVVHERVGEDGEIQEISRLLVHGITHLMGYDHINDADAKRMETVEKELWGVISTQFHLNT
ncbi:rRNA maturation RNase YbeY [Myxococcota bacterium]|nr:rRNA maturation RNase YbeY [Myxococcota bacterium]